MPRERAYTTPGLLAAAAGTFSWGFGVILFKLTSSPFLIVIFYRHLISIPLVFAAWRLTRKQQSRLPWAAAGVGGALFAAHQMANFGALRYSTAAVVTIFFSLQPILIGALGRRITGETTTVRFYLWALVAVGGCAILVLASAGQPHTSTLGTVLAVANLFLWSAYYLATKRARAQVETMSWLLVMLVVSGTIIGAVAAVARQPFTAPSGTEWMYIGLLAVFPGTVGHMLVTWAQPHVHAAASSALVLMIPIVATAGAAVFVHEHFGPWEAVGAAIAIVGAGFAMRHLPAPAAAEAAERVGEVVT